MSQIRGRYRAFSDSENEKRKNQRARLRKRGHLLCALAVIEDNNHRELGEIAARGTLIAHNAAKNVSGEIIFVRKGKLVRQIDGKKVELVKVIGSTKVNADKKYTVKRG